MNLNQLLDMSEHEAFRKAMYRLSDRCIRPHVRRLDIDLPFQVNEVPWFAGGLFLVDSTLRPASFLNYATADYYIQDGASLLPLALLDPQADDMVCDLCASPGGKASAIAERLGKSGFLLANESIRSRVDVLRYALARTGNPCFAVSTYDPDDLASQMIRSFDAVLVDAPCSGQTLVARSKRNDNAFSDNQIDHCVLRQQRILQSAIRMLKPGGRLIYSTCTFAIEENESQIQWLHEQYPDAWEPIEPKGLEPWRSPIQAGCYRLWPHRDRCAGGFAAGLRLVKEIEFNAISIGDRTGIHREISIGKAKQRTELDKRKGVQEVLVGLGQFNQVTTDWKSGYAQCLTSGVFNAMRDHPGVSMDPMAVLVESGNHFVPTQGLALLDDAIFTPRAVYALEKEHAKQFAGGASIAISPDAEPSTSVGVRSRGVSGWAVATWNGRPLGWCKALSNRLNNHLPPWARLTVT